MEGHLCRPGALATLVKSAAKRNLDLAAAKNEERDATRGIHEVAVPAEEVPEGIFPTMSVPKEQLWQVIQEVKGMAPRKAAKRLVAKLSNGKYRDLCLEALLENRNPSSPLTTFKVVCNALRCLRLMNPSIDLTCQYTEEGELTGHNDFEAVSMWPRWGQAKGSGLALDTVLLLSAQIASNLKDDDPEKQDVLSGIGQFLNALAPEEADYKRARWGRGRRLSPQGCQVVAEADSPLRPSERDDKGEKIPRDCPALKARLASTDTPAPDVEAMARGYKAVPKRLPKRFRRCSRKVLRRLRANRRALLAELQAIEAMSPEEVAAKGASYAPIADLLEQEQPGLRLHRNADGMPTGIFPADTATKTLLIYFTKVSARLLFDCDAAVRQLRTWGVEKWEKGNIWRVIAASVIHEAQYGAVDTWVILPFDFSGSSHSLLGVCGAAHERHALPVLGRAPQRSSPARTSRASGMPIVSPNPAPSTPSWGLCGSRKSSRSYTVSGSL